MDARVERVEKIVPENATCGRKGGGKREAISLRNDAIQRRELINQSWPHAAYPEKGRKKGERDGGGEEGRGKNWSCWSVTFDERAWRGVAFQSQHDETKGEKPSERTD